MPAIPPVVPGLYPGPGQASLLRPNNQQYLLQGQSQASAVGNASIAVQLGRIQDSYPFGASFEIAFSGAPGTFEIDIQTADTDVPGNFVTISSLTGGLNSSNVGRVELPNFWAKYVRVFVKTLTNNVTTSVLVTR
jgi:hypothetical protein